MMIPDSGLLFWSHPVYSTGIQQKYLSVAIRISTNNIVNCTIVQNCSGQNGQQKQTL